MTHTSQNFLRPIVDPPDANIDIVAVHGLNPVNSEFHAEGTWTDGDKLWLRDFLPAKLPRARVLLFGYNSNIAFENSAAGVLEQAENLLNRLQLKRPDPSRPIIFVCHSLGGIVVKQALVHAKLDDTYEQIRSSTYGIIFFGTPHRGGHHALLGDIASKVVRAVLRNPKNTFMEALKKDSLFADTLINSFRHQLEDYHILTFYETRPMGAAGIIVDKQSATLGLAGRREKQLPVDADHTHVCKFASATDDIYDQVQDNMVAIVNEAVAAAANRERLLNLEHSQSGRVPQGELNAGRQGEPQEDSEDGDERQTFHRDLYISYDDVIHVFESLQYTQMNERWERVPEAHSKTFEWILPAPTHADLEESITNMLRKSSSPNLFLKWLVTDDQPLFWISGKAASGKSTLTKYLAEHEQLKQILLSRVPSEEAANLVFASFFFFDQGKSALQMSREGLLRSLLHQVLRGRRALQRVVLDAKCRSVYQNRKHRRSPQEARPEVEWSWKDLDTAFKTFAAHKPENMKLFLLIDGLDEFRLIDHFDDYLEYEDDEDSEQAQRNIDGHRVIAKFFLALSQHKGVKLCLSSRPLQVFEDAFRGYPGFKLQDLTLNDIKRYIQDKLENHFIIQSWAAQDKDRIDELVMKISHKANGVFLWVTLVVRILLNKLEAGLDPGPISLQMDAAIDRLPAKLRGPNGLYARMLSDILEEFKVEGFELFSRVLMARSNLTVLALAFSRESSSVALQGASGRIPEDDANFMAGQMDRCLKSRCNGLLEISANPLASKFAGGIEHAIVVDTIPWSKRPHITLDPIVIFTHRTAVEFLQSLTFSRSRLSLRIDTNTDTQLLVSCLLRIKRIGQTAHVWEIWHAVKDAVYYAKRIEDRDGVSPVALLDEVDSAMRAQWAQDMTAGRPNDYDQDPGGYDDNLKRIRELKELPKEGVDFIPTLWGPQYFPYTIANGADSVLTLAVQTDMLIYLKAKVEQHGFRTLNQGRPLLAYAVVPRSSQQPLNNLPLTENFSLANFSAATTVQYLISKGADPNEMCLDMRSVWYHALHNPVITFSEQSGPETTKLDAERLCEWAKTMTLLVENGADVTNNVLTFLYSHWKFLGRYSQEISALYIAVVKRAAANGIVDRRFRDITVVEMRDMDEATLQSQLKIHQLLRPEYQAGEKDKLKANQKTGDGQDIDVPASQHESASAQSGSWFRSMSNKLGTRVKRVLRR